MKATASNSPLVSVCIPTFNRAGMLRECIDSVLQQTLTDYEIIVSDNASEDSTESVVKSFKDKRIRYYRNDRNLGIRNNWERCLELATGEFITIFPDDDIMMPNNLVKKADYLAANPSVGLVHSKYHVINGDGEIVIYDTNWKHSADRTTDAIESKVDMLTADGNTINAPTVMFRKECYTRLGGFSDKLSYAIDWEYWMRIAVYYDVAFLATPLVKWREHDGRLTTKDLDTDHVRKLNEDLSAKKLIVDKHILALENGGHLRRLMWQQMSNRLAHLMDTMTNEHHRKSDARHLGIKMCLKYPELAFSRRILKSFLKTVLTRKIIDIVKVH